MELRGWLDKIYNNINDGEDDNGADKRIKACYGYKEIITTVRIHLSLKFDVC